MVEIAINFFLVLTKNRDEVMGSSLLVPLLDMGCIPHLSFSAMLQPLCMQENTSIDIFNMSNGFFEIGTIPTPLSRRPLARNKILVVLNFQKGVTFNEQMASVEGVHVYDSHY